MIKLKHIYKEYVIDEDLIFSALKDINLEIREGEYLSILAPSGSGKSTLMHIIGLLDKPTRGSLYINGKNISSFSDEETSKLRNRFVGFVFQQYNLINKLTVIENILLPTIYTRKNLSYNPHQKAKELMKKVGIYEKRNSYPNKLSGGQQQRVAIARALIMDPQLILADEPTGNLDTKTGKVILRILENLNKKDKKTVIIVTHDLEIGKRTNREIHLKDGILVNS